MVESPDDAYLEVLSLIVKWIYLLHLPFFIATLLGICYIVVKFIIVTEWLMAGLLPKNYAVFFIGMR